MHYINLHFTYLLVVVVVVVVRSQVPNKSRRSEQLVLMETCVSVQSFMVRLISTGLC